MPSKAPKIELSEWDKFALSMKSITSERRASLLTQFAFKYDRLGLAVGKRDGNGSLGQKVLAAGSREQFLELSNELLNGRCFQFEGTTTFLLDKYGSELDRQAKVERDSADMMMVSAFAFPILAMVLAALLLSLSVDLVSEPLVKVIVVISVAVGLLIMLNIASSVCRDAAAGRERARVLEAHRRKLLAMRAAIDVAPVGDGRETCAKALSDWLSDPSR
ncbi:hypothetical protein [Sorangium sp. So ce1000]|uniref:hypothetical protein n=1 Tax=Sorangium sp. So ce1000 TaxID=3133325 RepID=UPI003F5F2EF0